MFQGFVLNELVNHSTGICDYLQCVLRARNHWCFPDDRYSCDKDPIPAPQHEVRGGRAGQPVREMILYGRSRSGKGIEKARLHKPSEGF